jgi:hypothetical protein
MKRVKPELGVKIGVLPSYVRSLEMKFAYTFHSSLDVQIYRLHVVRDIEIIDRFATQHILKLLETQVDKLIYFIYPQKGFHLIVFLDIVQELSVSFLDIL